MSPEPGRLKFQLYSSLPAGSGPFFQPPRTMHTHIKTADLMQVRWDTLHGYYIQCALPGTVSPARRQEIEAQYERQTANKGLRQPGPRLKPIMLKETVP